MLKNSPAFAGLPLQRAWLPCDAPLHVGDDGCPVCGAMLCYGQPDKSKEGAAPDVPNLFKAHCGRGSLATRYLHRDLKQGGQTCTWEGWVRMNDEAQIRVIGHGAQRPATWSELVERPPRPEPHPNPLIPREALVSACVDLSDRARQFQSELTFYFEHTLKLNVPDHLLIGLARLRQLADTTAARADAGLYERRMAELRAEYAGSTDNEPR